MQLSVRSKGLRGSSGRPFGPCRILLLISDDEMKPQYYAIVLYFATHIWTHDPQVYPPYNCEGGQYVFQSSAAWVFPRGPAAEIWGTVRSWREVKAVITAIQDLRTLENIKSIYENTSILDFRCRFFYMIFKILLLNHRCLKSGEWKCFQAGLTMWRPIQRLLQGNGSWVGGQVWKLAKCHTFLMPFRR